MKSAKILLLGMYIHLLLSIIVPITIFIKGEWNSYTLGLLLFYVLMISAVHITGWICVAMAVNAYRKGDGGLLRNGLKLLKLGSIPFYILNFIYSFVVWFLLIGASRGLMGLLLPLPVAITCIMVFQSGCLGCCYVKYLKNQSKDHIKPAGIHYILQILPVFDVFSTIAIFRQFKANIL